MRFLPIFFLFTTLLACRSKPEQGTETPATDSAAATAPTATSPAATSPTAARPNVATQNRQFQVVPGQRVGVVTAGISEAALRDQLGADNVVHEDVSLGEFSEPGTVLYKGTPNEIQIIWKDKSHYAQPEAVILRPSGEGGTTPPAWRLPQGLNIGSTLREVERINGKPFKIWGFGWDQGGNVADWQQGRLQAADGKTYLSIRFGFDDLQPNEEKLAAKVMGDREFDSTNPILQQLNPKAQVITIRFK